MVHVLYVSVYVGFADSILPVEKQFTPGSINRKHFSVGYLTVDIFIRNCLRKAPHDIPASSLDVSEVSLIRPVNACGVVVNKLRSCHDIWKTRFSSMSTVMLQDHPQMYCKS